jgi:tetratricopeptide (TPR) repeat protein
MPSPPLFVGRESELQQLRDLLCDSPIHSIGSTVIITGIGGVGKTTLAAQYAQRYSGEYKIVWWVNASEPAVLVESMARLATEIGVVEGIGSDQRESAKAATRWLERSTRWLLVFDDVNDPQQIGQHLPTMHRGHIIVVSRNHNWKGRGTILNLLAFKREESVQLLLKAANSSDEGGARRLAERVGDLPLALGLCAASIKRSKAGFGACIDDLDALGVARTHQPTSIGPHIDLAVAPLAHESPDAVLLLNLCAFMGNEEISSDLLALAQPNPKALESALRTLERSGLATVGDSGVRIHDLVAQAIQQRLAPSEREHWITIAVSLLQSLLPPSESAHSVASLPAGMLAHVLSASNHARKEHVALASTARLLGYVGARLRANEDISAAKAVMELALSIAAQEPTVDKQEAAALLQEMGAISENLGDYTTAMTYCDRAVESLRPSGRADALGHALMHRGRLLYHLGRLTEALSAFQESLALARMLGSEDEVANRLGIIGQTFRSIGDFQAALAAYEEAISLHRRISATANPSVADLLNGLGSTCRAMGDMVRAKDCFEEALNIDREALGPKHPSAVVRLNNLATVLRELGQYERAASLLQEAIVVAGAALGSDDPQLGVLLKNLGQLHAARGEHIEAQHCLERALSLFEKTLGPGHAYARETTEQLAYLTGAPPL